MFFFVKPHLFIVVLADSSLRVKDVIKEFHAGGRLAQHSFGEVSHAAAPVQTHGQ